MIRTKLYLSAVLALAALGVSAIAQTPAFTFQGRLTDSTLPANGTYQMQFTVYDELVGGTAVGSTITNLSVVAANGVFTVVLDYSPQTPFASGDKRWIEIAVKKPADAGYTTLAPRQLITSAPYATKSLSSADSDKLGGLAANTYLQTNGNGSGLTNLNGANITNNTIPNAALSPAVTVAATTNSSLLGSLRWDLLRSQTNFAVGNSPRAIAFDGANIWVANYDSDTVTKLRASDGVVLGIFNVSDRPQGLVFDGTNIWVATNFGHLTKLRASDGANQGNFLFGTGCYGVAFDGEYIWATNCGVNNVLKVRAADGQLNNTFSFGDGPRGVAFDGKNIWVSHITINSVAKVQISDGTVIGSFLPSGDVLNIAFDGDSIWAVNDNLVSPNVLKRRASDTSNLGTFNVGPRPVAVAFDGTNVWVVNQDANNVTKLRASNGEVLGTFAVGTAPMGIAFDGANIWVTNSGSGNVTRLSAFP
ncbi:MAG: hypothetical protein IPG67_03435 [Acidobacteria bacterium]|nr:hypothetical protein [Acidobacteriota bacterium]